MLNDTIRFDCGLDWISCLRDAANSLPIEAVFFLYWLAVQFNTPYTPFSLNPLQLTNLQDRLQFREEVALYKTRQDRRLNFPLSSERLVTATLDLGFSNNLSSDLREVSSSIVFSLKLKYIF